MGLPAAAAAKNRGKLRFLLAVHYRQNVLGPKLITAGIRIDALFWMDVYHILVAYSMTVPFHLFSHYI